MSRKIVEETVIVGALTIFEAFKLNLARLLLFGVVDFFPSVGDVERVDGVDDEELKSPDDIGGIFDVARFFETLEGNGFGVVVAIERRNDEEGRIGITLKFFEFANGIIDAKFC